MKVQEIVNIIEKFAPCELAYPWDNTGFIIGDFEKEVIKVFVTLDITKETVNMAVECGADMIISHHPIMFKGIQRINYSDYEGYIIKELIKNDIALYVSHTSTDCTDGGINDHLAKIIGLKEYKKLNDDGLGRIGKLINNITLKEFAEIVKKALNTSFVRVCGDTERKINTIAVCGGSGSDLVDDAIRMGADVLVTGDIKYHTGIDVVHSGLALIDAGHYPTEVFVQDIFADLLRDTGIEVIKSTHKDIFKVV